MSGSKGVTVKELMSFLSYSRFDSHMLIWPHKYLLFDGAGSGQGSRIQFNGLEETPKLYLYLDRSSICMPGTGIVLVMNCHQRPKRTI